MSVAGDGSAWEDVLLVDAFALLPKVLLQRLRDCGPLVDADDTVVLNGAVATFTLGETGATDAGAEKHSDEVHLAFSYIVDSVIESGGDVFFLTESSVTALWQVCGAPSAESDDEAAYNAASAALNIRRAIENFSLSILSLQVNLACGPVYLLLLGGEGSSALGKWKFAMGGPAHEQLAQCSAVSKNNSIVATAALADRLRRKGCKVEASSVGPFVLLGGMTPLLPSFSQYRSYSPRTSCATALDESTSQRLAVDRKSVSTRDAAGCPISLISLFFFDTVGHTLGERAWFGEGGNLRSVTVLCLHLACPEVPAGRERQQVFHAVVRTVQKALLLVEGVLLRVVMVPNGIRTICVFGLPGHTHADDTDRAMRFTLRVVSKLKKKVGNVVAGVARGRCDCGLIGGDQRKDYALIGSVVPRACRMARLALEESTRSEHLPVVFADEEAVGHCSSAEWMGLTFTKVSSVWRTRSGDIFRGDTPGAGRRASEWTSVGELYLVEHTEPGEGKSVLQVALEGLNEDVRRNSSVGSGSVASRLASARTAAVLQQRVSKTSSNNSSHGRRHDDHNSRSPSSRSLRSVVRTSSRSSKKQSHMSSPRLLGVKTRFQEGEKEVVLHGPRGRVVGRAAEAVAIRAMIGSMAGHGRRDEKLDNALGLMGTRDNPDSILYFVGETQTGKTTLLKAAAQLAAQHGVQVVSFSGSETASMVPYAAVAQQISSYVDAAPLHVLDSGFAPEMRKHLPLLQHVLRLPQVGSPTEEHLAMLPQEKVETLHSVLKQLFKKITGDLSRALFVVDDLHWIDDLSCSFLLECIEGGSKMMISTSKRKRTLDVAQSQLLDLYQDAASSTSTDQGIYDKGFGAFGSKQRHALCQKLETQARVLLLGPLSKKYIGEILCNTFNTQHVDADLEDLLFTKSDGRPGCAVQMASTLLYGSVVQTHDKTALASNLQDLEAHLVHTVPHIESQVMQTLDKLSAFDRKVALLVSVFGRCTQDALGKALEVLGERGNLNLATGLLKDSLLKQAKNEYTYKLSLAKDVVYYSAAAREKRKMHTAVISVVVGDVSYDDAAVAVHLNRSSLSDAEAEEVYFKYYQKCQAKGDARGCLTALARPLREVPSPSPARDTRALLKLCCFYENGYLPKAHTALLSVSSRQRLAAFDSSAHASYCCPWYRPRLPPEATLLQLVYLVTKMELEFWDCNRKSIACAAITLGTIARKIPKCGLDRLAAHVVAVADGSTSISFAESPETIFEVLSLATTWKVRAELQKYHDYTLATGFNPLPLSWVTETGELVPKKCVKSEPKTFRRRSVLGVAVATKHAVEILLGGHIEEMDDDEPLDQRWQGYLTLLQAVSLEILCSTPTVPVTKAKPTWMDDDIAEEEREDAVLKLLSACLRALSHAKTASYWNVRHVIGLVESSVATVSPFHAIALWALCEAYFIALKNDWGSSRPSLPSIHSTTTLMSSQCAVSTLSPRSSSDTSTAFSFSELEVVLDAFHNMSLRYPVAVPSYQYCMALSTMLGTDPDGEVKASRHLTECLVAASKLGAGDCILAWRARVHLLLLRRTGSTAPFIRAACQDRYNPALGFEKVAEQLLNDAPLKANSSSEGKRLVLALSENFMQSHRP